MPGTAIYAIKDRMLQLTTTGNLVANDIPITSAAVDAVVTVAAEISDVRQITIQLRDANGVNIDYVESVDIVLFTSQARTAFAVTGGSTGIAIGASGSLLAVVAKKYFKATTNAAGLLALTYTDTGTEAVAIGVVLPTGRIVMGSSVLTNA